jgi:hypothetical protein
MQIKKTSIALASAAFVSAALVACGGGGGGDSAVSATSPAPTTTAPATTTPAPTTSSISGVAATGQAMVGATITITDANGVTATKTADSAGSYSVDVTAMTAPFVITATSQVGDTQLSLTSMLAEKPAAGSTGTANITPLTNAMAALLAPHGNPEELAAPAVLKTAVTKAKLDEVTAKIRTAIENILKDAGLDSTKFDPVSTVFAANRQGADRVLELVRVEVTGQGVSLTNPSVQDDGKGSSSVQITPATSVVAKLPAPPVGTVLDSLDHFAALLDACFADAPAVRVTAKDASGVPTTVSAACNAVPMAANYKSGGDAALTRYAGLLNSADLTGAKFSKPERVFTSATTGRVFFKLPYKTAAGAGGIITDTAEQTNPLGKLYKWEIVGNQRDFDSTIDARLDNISQLNPNNTQESNKDQYRVALRLSFNPINAAGMNVQTVRVKGPGLPAAGVVMHRSSVCGTNDYMTVTNKTGSLLNSLGKPILFNSGTTNNFKLAGELKSGTAYDWTKVGANSSWRDTPMVDAELAAIPSFAEYTWELWTFGAGRTYRSDITITTPADITYTQRLTSRPPSVSSLKSLPWNSIAANDFISPTSTLAAPQTAVTVNWKSTAEPVDYAAVFGQRNAAAVGTTPASFVRISADSAATGVKISATSKTVSPVNDPSGTASLVGVVGGAPVIPNCSSVQFPAFDAVAGTKDAVNSYATYRDLTVRSRSYSLARKYVTNSWNNFID